MATTDADWPRRSGRQLPFIPNLAKERVKRDVRRLLASYRERGDVVRFSTLMLRVQARFTFLHIDRAELLSIIAAEAKQTGLVMEFDKTD